jgi:hypothetical protein
MVTAAAESHNDAQYLQSQLYQLEGCGSCEVTPCLANYWAKKEL